jgi:hypothetical protein
MTWGGAERVACGSAIPEILTGVGPQTPEQFLENNAEVLEGVRHPQPATYLGGSCIPHSQRREFEVVWAIQVDDRPVVDFGLRERLQGETSSATQWRRGVKPC